MKSGSTTASILVSQFFWFMATLDVLVLIAIEVWICIARTRSLKPDPFTSLVRSQRKDTWLVCAAVWIEILSDGFPMQWSIHFAGAVALLWILRRTVQRLRSFLRGE